MKFLLSSIVFFTAAAQQKFSTMNATGSDLEDQADTRTNPIPWSRARNESTTIDVSSSNSFSEPTRKSIAGDFFKSIPSGAVARTSYYDARGEIRRIFNTLPPQEEDVLLSIHLCAVRMDQYWRNGYNEFINQSSSLVASGVGGGMQVSEGPVGGTTWNACDGVDRVSYDGSPQTGMVTSLGEAVYNSGTTYADGPAPCDPKTLPITSFCSHMRVMSREFMRSSIESLRQGSSIKWMSAPEYSGIEELGCPRQFLWCQFNVASAHVLYWPGVTTRSNICEQGVAGQSVTEPRMTAEMIMNGTTYTSPSVYITYSDISYESVSYSGNATFSTTYSLKSLVASLHPDNASTVCGPRRQQATFSFNFEDLQDPIPWSAWVCKPGCIERPRSCLPIDPLLSSHRPRLAWPNTFLSMLHSLNTINPDDCDFGVDEAGVWDPPQLLTMTDRLLGPPAQQNHPMTKPESITKESPAPSNTPIGPATATAFSITSASSITEAPHEPITAPTAPAQSIVSPHQEENVESSHPLRGIGSLIDAMLGRPPQVPQVNPVQPPNQPAEAPQPELVAVNPETRLDTDARKQAAPSGNGDGLGGFIVSMLVRPSSRMAAGDLSEKGLVNPPVATAQSDADSTLEPSPISDVSVLKPLRAVIPIKSSAVTVFHEASDAFVLSGTTHRVGDTVTLEGQSVVFRTDGVDVMRADASATVHPASFIRFTVPALSSSREVAVLSVNGEAMPLYRDPDGVVQLGSSAINEGDLTKILAGSLEVMSNGVVLKGASGTVTATFSAFADPRASTSVVAVAGQMVTLGKPAVTVAGRLVSYGAAGLVIDHSTMQIDAMPTQMTMANGAFLKVSAVKENGIYSIGGLVASVLVSSFTTFSSPGTLAGIDTERNGTPTTQPTQNDVERRPTSPPQDQRPRTSSDLSAQSTGGANGQAFPMLLLLILAVISGGLAVLL
ncbi:Hypothetical protein D9617_10g073010 [Elsinoe fawcettii]|nr:Hypothetical protein D9617_10g073010 [Elsinoe fawcettii]